MYSINRAAGSKNIKVLFDPRQIPAKSDGSNNCITPFADIYNVGDLIDLK